MVGMDSALDCWRDSVSLLSPAAMGPAGRGRPHAAMLKKAILALIRAAQE
jgi:hypothetical protein